MTDRMGQVCMTCDEAADAVAEEVKRLLESNPDCNIVSVSQGDNKNFCTCEKCREKTAHVGLTRAYYDFINAVACKIYEYRPDVLVHTFAYMNLCDVGDEFALAPNIMIQYCTAGCTIHPIGGCEHNADQAKNLAVWSKMCKNVFIWDYINCFKYELMDMPTVYNCLENLRTFARCGVKGVFNEGAHDTAYDKKCGFVGMPELRGYLMSAAMWNPDMSDEEYQTRIDEFCAAFLRSGRQSGGGVRKTSVRVFSRKSRNLRLQRFRNAAFGRELYRQGQNRRVSFPRVRAYKTRRRYGKRRIRSAPRKTPYRNYLLRPLS